MSEMQIKNLGDLQTCLNEIKSGLDTRIQNQIDPLKHDLNETIKAVDFMQTKGGSKYNVASSTVDAGFRAQMARGLVANMDNLTKFAKSEIKSFRYEVKAVQDMTLGTNYSGGTTAIAAPTLPGVQNIPNKPLHVRDLLKTTKMTGSSLPVLIDAGGEGAPAPTAEGETKPLFDFDLSEIAAKAETIAGVVVLSKQFLDDVPNAANWLLDRMIEKYMEVEDAQLLNGNGTSPNLKGINTTGNYTAATSLAADNDVVQLVKGILQLRALNRNPTGIVIHPDNLGSILLNTATGSGEFDLPSYVSVNAVGGISILGVPVVTTTAQTADVYDVIDNSGMLLAVRQDTTIEFFEQDSVNIRQNKISVRIESRLAFPVYGPRYVVKGNFV